MKTVLERATRAQIRSMTEGGGRDAVRTEPAQNRPILQTALRSNTTPFGEHGAQHEHIQFRLMVSHQHRGPCLSQGVGLIVHGKPDSREEQHAPFEGSGGGVLAETATAPKTEEGRGDGAIGCAEKEGAEGGDGSSIEA